MEIPEQQEVFQAQYIPSQTQPFERQSSQDMKVDIISYPPLGQITVIRGRTVTFTVHLEADRSKTHDQWETALWYTSGNYEWQSLRLHLLEEAEHPVEIDLVKSHNPGKRTHFYFRGSLNTARITQFTVKFRVGDGDWKWAKESQGLQDGTLIQAPSHDNLASERLEDLIGDLNPALEYKKVMSETPKTSVWSLTTSIVGANGKQSSWKKLRLGRPWNGRFLRWFALVRIWSPWLCPRQGGSHFELDKEAVMCSFLDENGRHLVILAVSGVGDVMTLVESDDEGYLILNIRNDGEKEQKARVVVATGAEFEFANAAAMYQARSMVSRSELKIGQEVKEVQSSDGEVESKWMENWYDGLTYCTWNGLGQSLTEENVLKAVDVLAENNINITNLIIDDNWQNLDYRGQGQFQHGWSTFEADPKTFPSGLKILTAKIRKAHPNIQHIAVWHALWGYWGGIDPTGQIAKDYKTVEAVRVDGKRRNLPLGGKVTIIAKEDVQRFYDDFYTFLSSSGVDAVKTDAQFMFDTLRDADDRRNLFTSYLDAWTISFLRHFSIKAISCMSQTPQIMFHSQLPSNRPAILVRNSDDFFPEVPSSHTWHVWTNAHNALMTQHLNIIPDWDMFQTVHDYSEFHAAARCVSGGPIYITDVPGSHDLNLIKQMTGETIRGKTIVFRPSVIGKSLDQYIGYDDCVLLKIGTYHGSAIIGTSIIGVFNTSPTPLKELLHLSRFLGTVEAQLYVIRSHASGLLSKPLQINDPSSLVSISLGIRDFDILSAYPLRGFTKPGSETMWIASLGLIDKMVGAAAVMQTVMTMDDQHKLKVSCSLKAIGKFGLYISRLGKDLSLEENFLVMILGKVVPIHCFVVKDKLLEIDIARAWAEMKLDSQWSNEVRIEILAFNW